MAVFPDSTLLPKLHPGLSRRSLMREMAAAGALAAAPVAAVAAPVPRTSPWVRLSELIEEIVALAQEIDPTIKDWVVETKDMQMGGAVPFVIAAFANPPDTDPLINYGWTYRHGHDSKNKASGVRSPYWHWVQS